jgi:O-6-methylguanine DNA methyltransferase
VHVAPQDHPHLEKLERQLAEYFAGKRKEFTVLLHPHGTEFEQQAWDYLRQIPYGETRTYGQQAKAIKNPAAVRAVGRANGHNDIAIVIPCHRVIGANGDLTGYASGLPRKRWLLQHEQRISGGNLFPS